MLLDNSQDFNNQNLPQIEKLVPIKIHKVTLDQSIFDQFLRSEERNLEKYLREVNQISMYDICSIDLQGDITVKDKNLSNFDLSNIKVDGDEARKYSISFQECQLANTALRNIKARITFDKGCNNKNGPDGVYELCDVRGCFDIGSESHDLLLYTSIDPQLAQKQLSDDKRLAAANEVMAETLVQCKANEKEVTNEEDKKASEKWISWALRPVTRWLAPTEAEISSQEHTKAIKHQIADNTDIKKQFDVIAKMVVVDPLYSCLQPPHGSIASERKQVIIKCGQEQLDSFAGSEERELLSFLLSSSKERPSLLASLNQEIDKQNATIERLTESMIKLDDERSIGEFQKLIKNKQEMLIVLKEQHDIAKNILDGADGASNKAQAWLDAAEKLTKDNFLTLFSEYRDKGGKVEDVPLDIIVDCKDLRVPELQNKQISKADFSGAALTGKLSNCTLQEVNFTGASVSVQCKLNGCKIVACNMDYILQADEKDKVVAIYKECLQKTADIVEGSGFGYEEMKLAQKELLAAQQSFETMLQTCNSTTDVVRAFASTEVFGKIASLELDELFKDYITNVNDKILKIFNARLEFKNCNIQQLSLIGQIVRKVSFQGGSIKHLEVNKGLYDKLALEECKVEYLKLEDNVANKIEIRNAEIDKFNIQAQKCNELLIEGSKLQNGIIENIDAINIKLQEVQAKNIKILEATMAELELLSTKLEGCALEDLKTQALSIVGGEFKNTLLSDLQAVQVGIEKVSGELELLNSNMESVKINSDELKKINIDGLKCVEVEINAEECEKLSAKLVELKNLHAELKENAKLDLCGANIAELKLDDKDYDVFIDEGTYFSGSIDKNGKIVFLDKNNQEIKTEEVEKRMDQLSKFQKGHFASLRIAIADFTKFEQKNQLFARAASFIGISPAARIKLRAFAPIVTLLVLSVALSAIFSPVIMIGGVASAMTLLATDIVALNNKLKDAHNDSKKLENTRKEQLNKVEEVRSQVVQDHKSKDDEDEVLTKKNARKSFIISEIALAIVAAVFGAIAIFSGVAIVAGIAAAIGAGVGIAARKMFGGFMDSVESKYDKFNQMRDARDQLKKTMSKELEEIKKDKNNKFLDEIAAAIERDLLSSPNINAIASGEQKEKMDMIESRIKDLKTSEENNLMQLCELKNKLECTQADKIQQAELKKKTEFLAEIKKVIQDKIAHGQEQEKRPQNQGLAFGAIGTLYKLIQAVKGALEQTTSNVKAIESKKEKV